MKRQIIYLMVKVDLESNFESISDTAREVESKADLFITGLPTLKIVETEILITRVPNPKKTKHHGTQS